MGSEKRERQKLSRQAKIEAAEIAARRSRTKRTGLRVAVAAIVVIGAMFAYSAISGGDDDDGATDDAASDNTSTTLAGDACLPGVPPEEYSNPELADEVLAREAPDPEAPPADTAADALEETTLIEGEGEGAAACDTVVVHYVGKTSDGQVFDESWSGGQPFPVTLGTEPAQVIAGWDQGLLGAKIGERRHLLIGSENGYGATGSGEQIPPDSPLAFDVDVIDIVRADQPAEGDGSDETEPTETTEPTDTTETTEPAG